MADRYWVGGAGTWNSSSTANWSSTSGGSGGYSVPTILDNVYINSASGTGTITVIGTVNAKYLSVSANFGTITVDLGSSTINLSEFQQFLNMGWVTGTGTLNFTAPALGGIVFTPFSTATVFYNVVFNFPNPYSSATVKAAFSATNWTINNNFATSGTSGVRLYGGTTTVSTFTANGGAVNRRIQISNREGGYLNATIAATTPSISNVDFCGITGVGGSWVGSNLGNGGANTGISGYAAAKTVYWSNPSNVSTWNFLGDYWATSSGGTPSSANFPLPQDTCIVDSAGVTAGMTICMGTTTVNNEYGLQIIPTLSTTTTTSIQLIPIDDGEFTYQLVRFNGSLDFGTAFTHVKAYYPPLNILKFSTAGTVNYSFICGTLGNASVLHSGGTQLTVRGNISEFDSTSTTNSVVLSSQLRCYRDFRINGGTLTLAGYDIKCEYTIEFASPPVCDDTLGYIVSDLANATASQTVYGAGSPTLRFATLYGGSRSLTFPATFSAKDLSINSAVYLDAVTCYGTFSTGSSAVFSSTSTLTLTGPNNRSLQIYQTWPSNIIINATGTVSLGRSLTLGAAASLTISNGGTFDAGIYSVSVGVGGNILISGCTLNMGSNNWIVGGNFTVTAGAGMAVNRGTATILMASSSSKQFSGGGFTYGTLNQYTTSQLTITGSNRFANITATGRPSTIRFTVGTTTTCDAFTLSGTDSSNRVAITSTSTAAFTLTSTAGTVVNTDWLSISRSTATGGYWYAGVNSLNVVGNTGWVFGAFPTNAGLLGLIM